MTTTANNLTPAEAAVFAAMTPTNLNPALSEPAIFMVVKRCKLNKESIKALKGLILSDLVRVEKLGHCNDGYYFVIATPKGIAASGISDGQPVEETEPRRLWVAGQFRAKRVNNFFILLAKTARVDLNAIRAWSDHKPGYTAQDEAKIDAALVELGYVAPAETTEEDLLAEGREQTHAVIDLQGEEDGIPCYAGTEQQCETYVAQQLAKGLPADAFEIEPNPFYGQPLLPVTTAPDGQLVVEGSQDVSALLHQLAAQREFPVSKEEQAARLAEIQSPGYVNRTYGVMGSKAMEVYGVAPKSQETRAERGARLILENSTYGFGVKPADEDSDFSAAGRAELDASFDRALGRLGADIAAHVKPAVELDFRELNERLLDFLGGDVFLSEKQLNDLGAKAGLTARQMEDWYSEQADLTDEELSRLEAQAITLGFKR